MNGVSCARDGWAAGRGGRTARAVQTLVLEGVAMLHVNFADSCFLLGAACLSCENNNRHRRVNTGAKLYYDRVLAFFSALSIDPTACQEKCDPQSGYGHDLPSIV